MPRRLSPIARVATGVALWSGLAGGLFFGALAVWDWVHVRGWPVESAEIVSSVRTGETQSCGRAGSADIYRQTWVSQDPPTGLPGKFTNEEGCNRGDVGEAYDVVRVVSDTGDVQVWVEPASSLAWVILVAGVGLVGGYLLGFLAGAVSVGVAAYRSHDVRRARPIGAAFSPPPDLVIDSGGIRIRGSDGSIHLDGDGIHLRRDVWGDTVTTVAWKDVRRLEVNVPWTKRLVRFRGVVNALRTDGSPGSLTVRVRELWRDHTVDLGRSTFSGWPLHVAVTLLLHEIGPEDFERADWSLLTDDELIRWAFLDLPPLIADRPPRGGAGDLNPIEFRSLGNEKAIGELKRRVAEARERGPRPHRWGGPWA